MNFWHWIPACAGMTGMGSVTFSRKRHLVSLINQFHLLDGIGQHVADIGDTGDTGDLIEAEGAGFAGLEIFVDDLTTDVILGQVFQIFD